MRYPSSPTVDLLVVFGLVFAVQRIAGALGFGPGWFALATPLVRPWTLATGVYAHASLPHLVANAVALVVVGLPLERFTTRLRFHGFVLATGAFAGVGELVVAGLLGRSAAVLGASGAVLALYGYVLGGNPLTGGLLGRVDLGRRAELAVLAGVALAVVVLTAGPGVAIVAHVVGALLGWVAGRAHLLRPARANPSAPG